MVFPKIVSRSVAVFATVSLMAGGAVAVSVSPATAKNVSKSKQSVSSEFELSSTKLRILKRQASKMEVLGNEYETDLMTLLDNDWTSSYAQDSLNRLDMIREEVEGMVKQKTDTTHKLASSYMTLAEIREEQNEDYEELSEDLFYADNSKDDEVEEELENFGEDSEEDSEEDFWDEDPCVTDPSSSLCALEDLDYSAMSQNDLMMQLRKLMKTMHQVHDRATQS